MGVFLNSSFTICILLISYSYTKELLVHSLKLTWMLFGDIKSSKCFIHTSKAKTSHFEGHPLRTMLLLLLSLPYFSAFAESLRNVIPWEDQM